MSAADVMVYMLPVLGASIAAYRLGWKRGAAHQARLDRGVFRGDLADEAQIARAKVSGPIVDTVIVEETTSR